MNAFKQNQLVKGEDLRLQPIDLNQVVSLETPPEQIRELLEQKSEADKANRHFDKFSDTELSAILSSFHDHSELLRMFKRID